MNAAPAVPAAEPPPHSARPSASLVLGALGVVFGDIGTSPLYTFQECVTGKHGVRPEPEAILGVTSLIVWAVTLVVTVKYLGFLMRADNRGEGGIMALLALAPEKRAGAGSVGAVALLVIVGAALLFGDGVITPAISVLSAVEGLEVATTRLHPVVIPLTVAILFLLFLAQRRGAGGLGRLFGPIMVAWFFTIGALGVWHLARHPSILTALSPHHAVRFFAAHGWRGFRVLGGVVLAVTGGEALYADMGHFGRPAIRIAWLSLIYPALLCCYLGQGAALIANPAAAASPLYALVPSGAWIYPMVALSAAATVIASQALISGVFSLTHQAIRLGYFPRLTVRHTSRDAEGQIYLPLMNWGLAISCIALVLIFRQSSRLAAAFGLAVSGTMLITSLVFWVVTRYTWRWSAWRAGLVLVFFLSFDVPFVVANTIKFLDGGYLPFMIGLVFVAIMVVWRRGRELVAEHFRSLAQPVAGFLAGLQARVVGRVPGVAVFMSSVSDGIPSGLERVVDRFHVLYEHTLVLKVQTEHVPFVPPAERFAIEDLGLGIQRVTLRYGFMDQPDVPAALAPTFKRLDPAPASCALYVIGREHFIGSSGNRMGAVSEKLFDFLSRNARRATDDLQIPPEQVVEIGTQIDL